MTEKTTLTPNVRRLLIERASQLQVEHAKQKYGSAGVGELAASIADSNGQVLKDTMRQAFEWTKSALEAIRRAPGSEKWPTDEDAAGEVLRLIEERRRKR